MKNKIRKPIAAFGLLAALLAAMVAVVLFVNVYFFVKKSISRNTLKLEGTVNTMNLVSQNQLNAYSDSREKTMAAVEMMCLALQHFVAEDGYNGPEIFDDGVVLRVVKGEIVYPDGFSGVFPDLTSEALADHFFSSAMQREGESDKIPSVLASGEITDNIWYVTFSPEIEYYEKIDLLSRQEGFLSDTEKSYGGYIFLVLADDPDMPLIYYSNDFPQGLEKISDLGISREDILERKDLIVFNNIVYNTRYVNLNFLGSRVLVILMLSAEEESEYAVVSDLLAVLLVLFIMTAVIVWLYQVQRYVQDHDLTEEQKETYHPQKMWRITASVGLICTILIFVVTFSVQLISNLYREANANRDSMQIVMNRLENSEKQTSYYQQNEEEWSVFYAEHLAGLMREYPELRTRAFLSKVSKIINADYIMLFDENGNELMCSNSFVNFTLGTTEDDETADFRRLLMGVDSIVHAPGIEKNSQKYVQMVGTRVPFDEENNGALILAMNPSETWEASEKNEFSKFIQMITPAGSLCAIESLESGKIIYSSDPKAVGETSDEVGLAVESNDSSILDSFTVNGKQYYGAYDKNDENRFFYLSENRHIQLNTFPFALCVTICFIVIYVIISVFMLKPYRADVYEKTVTIVHSAQSGVMLEEDNENRDPQNKPQNIRSGIKEQLQNLPPEKKVTAVVQLFLSVLLIILVLQLFNSSSTVNFILFGNWKRGINLMSVSGIILLSVLFAMFVLLKNSFTRLLDNVLDPKGLTIWKLVMNLLQYIAFILFLFYTFTYLGFNTTVLLTSVSILSLAISLGSKDLVADILAGIFLVFEDDFHVGDIIEVNGFRGKVMEIGVRSTRLIGMGDNIKIIGNQSVKNILNMSRLNSWYTMELKISADVPVDEIEKMLEQELPKIGESIPEVISGPHYKGVWAISGDTNTLSVITECREENFRHVQRDVNRAIRLLFEEKGYKLK